MFIAVIGTRCSGRRSLENWLVTAHNFQRVRLSPAPDQEPKENNGPAAEPHDLNDALVFHNVTQLLNFVTKSWLRNYVTTDLRMRNVLELFGRRPFFLLLSVDAPLFKRYQRLTRSHQMTLEDFVKEDDKRVFGSPDHQFSSLRDLSDLINIRVNNDHNTLPDFHTHLERLNLLDPNHLRPGWDAYFMTLASLASRRSNCMKRRVGAILVRENRILAAGYNGTPRGVKNCNEGGCTHCNSSSSSNSIPYECVCLHAEENALLEAGRERVGDGAVLYCNTCPCLKCTIKIIQTGVTTVVYNLSYKVDEASASLFQAAGVELRKYDPSQVAHLPSASTDQSDSLELPGITTSQ